MLTNYEEFNINNLPKDFTGTVVTGRDSSSCLILQIWKDGQIEESFTVESDESIQKAIIDNVLEYECEDILVDSNYLYLFEDNLMEYPYDDTIADDDDSLCLLSPEERAALEDAAEEEAEDAFTRFCDSF